MVKRIPGASGRAGLWRENGCESETTGIKLDLTLQDARNRTGKSPLKEHAKTR